MKVPVVIKRSKGSKKNKSSDARSRRTGAAHPEQDQLIIIQREDTKPRRRAKAVPKPPSPLRNAIQGAIATIALVGASAYIGMQVFGGSSPPSGKVATVQVQPVNLHAAAASLPKGPVTNKAGLTWKSPNRTPAITPVKTQMSEPEPEIPAAPEGIH
ncbi:MAG TPA: hypothetical protein VNJ09_06895 [Chthonomonadales bacterium]|nr:hypothetical protein [Chthonomonadales bacterium]